MTVSTLFFLVSAFYFVQCSIFIYGLIKKRSKKNPGYEPTVSIVLAARNEENNIAACLASLIRIDYPKAKIEIIVVDDNSTDATSSIISEITAKNSRITAITASESIDHLRGKANAIAQGIDISTGEIIIMTDADCVVPPSWIRATVQTYASDVGVVAGLTLLHPTNWFAGMQSLDWAYILAVASASMSLRNPLSCIGNNFSFRRKAYDEIGGYRKIEFSVTEDFALFKAITRSGRWDYRYPLEYETLVFSNACKTLPDLYRQKRRWGVGGKNMPASGMMIMVVAFCMHALLLCSLFLEIPSPLLMTGLLGKLLGDFVLLAIPLGRSGQLSQIKYFVLFEFYFILYVIMLPFAVFLGGSVAWKGRKY